MAYADYRLCDLCNAKTFYDAGLEYSGAELPRVGSLSVICCTCAESHRTIVCESTAAARIAEIEAEVARRGRLIEAGARRGVTVEGKHAPSQTCPWCGTDPRPLLTGKWPHRDDCPAVTADGSVRWGDPEPTEGDAP